MMRASVHQEDTRKPEMYTQQQRLKVQETETG